MSGVIIEDNVVDIRLLVDRARRRPQQHRWPHGPLLPDAHRRCILRGRDPRHRKTMDRHQVYDMATRVKQLRSALSTGTAHHTTSGQLAMILHPQHRPRLRPGSDLPGWHRHRLRQPQQRHLPRRQPRGDADGKSHVVGGRPVHENFLAPMKAPPRSASHRSAAARGVACAVGARIILVSDPDPRRLWAIARTRTGAPRALPSARRRAPARTGCASPPPRAARPPAARVQDR